MNRKILLLFFIVLITSILFSGCGAFFYSVYKHSQVPGSYAAAPERDKYAKEMSATDEKALVYLYRSGGIFRPFLESNYELYINNKCVAGALWPDGFYVWLLSPGVYTFQSQGSKLVLMTVAGETYYIRQTGDYFKLHQTLEFVDNQLGRMRVAEAPLLKCRSIKACGRANKSEEAASIQDLTSADDKALVYVYRTDFSHDSLVASVRLDRGIQKRITAGGYSLWEVLPGTHHIIANNGEELSLNVMSGETYYVRLDAQDRWYGTGKYLLQVVNNKVGRKDIEQLQADYACLEP